MTDPFQDVDATGPDFVETVTGVLESRAAEAQMVPVIERYLDRLDWSGDALHVEVGCGTGPVARRMAARAGRGRVVGIDPSAGLIASARERAADLPNLAFETGDGTALPFEPNTVRSIVMHTVLSHVPEPTPLLVEASRVLEPGGRLVVCDADFAKSSLGNFDGDPLDACATYFVRHFVTRPYVIAEIRGLVSSVGYDLEDFRIDSRAMIDTDGGLGWIRLGGAQMVERGLVDEALVAALANEYVRRKEAGTLYGHQPFGTLVAVKPG